MNEILQATSKLGAHVATESLHIKTESLHSSLEVADLYGNELKSTVELVALLKDGPVREILQLSNDLREVRLGIDGLVSKESRLLVDLRLASRLLTLRHVHRVGGQEALVLEDNERS